MRMIILSAVCALGLGLFASTGASAAPIAGLSGAANYTPIEQVQFRRHRVCRVVTRCHRGFRGRRICRTERICRR